MRCCNGEEAKAQGIGTHLPTTSTSTQTQNMEPQSKGGRMAHQFRGDDLT